MFRIKSLKNAQFMLFYCQVTLPYVFRIKSMKTAQFMLFYSQVTLCYVCRIKAMKNAQLLSHKCYSVYWKLNFTNIM